MSGTKGINLWLRAQTELIKQQTKDDRDGLPDIPCPWFSGRIVFLNEKSIINLDAGALDLNICVLQER